MSESNHLGNSGLERIYLTTKDTATLVGCTLRQLQYWRKRSIVVPVVNPIGTGYSAYYDQKNVIDLFIINYLVTRGYDLKIAGQILWEIKEIGINYIDEEAKPILVYWDETLQKFLIQEYSEELFKEFTKNQKIFNDIFSLVLIPINVFHKKFEKIMEVVRNRQEPKSANGSNIISNIPKIIIE
jgi:DNA-binding transcriptional MerR regulator